MSTSGRADDKCGRRLPLRNYPQRRAFFFGSGVDRDRACQQTSIARPRLPVLRNPLFSARPIRWSLRLPHRNLFGLWRCHGGVAWQAQILSAKAVAPRSRSPRCCDRFDRGRGRGGTVAQEQRRALTEPPACDARHARSLARAPRCVIGRSTLTAAPDCGGG